MQTEPLRLHRPEPAPPELPPNHGQLLGPDEVADLVGRSAGWCRRNVAHKLTLGWRTVRWYEADVRAWLETRRAA